MYVIRIYTAGPTRRSEKALKDLKNFLEGDFKGQYVLETIDVMDSPELAERDGVLATPSAIRVAPPPEKRIIGDFGNKENVRVGLGM